MLLPTGRLHTHLLVHFSCAVGPCLALHSNFIVFLFPSPPHLPPPTGVPLAVVQPTSGDVNLLVRVLAPAPNQPPTVARIGDASGVALLDLRSPAQVAAVGPPGTVVRLARARPAVHHGALHIGVSKWGAIERQREGIDVVVDEAVRLSERTFGTMGKA